MELTGWTLQDMLRALAVLIAREHVEHHAQCAQSAPTPRAR